MGTNKKGKSNSAKKPTQATKVRAHAPRTGSNKRARRLEKDRHLFIILKRAILGIIILAMLAVILTILFAKFYNPESLVTKKINDITADYYETYFYPRIENYGTTNKTLAEIMSRYTETGFSKVTLRQLLLFDSARHADASDLLTKYCDPEATYAKIYPVDPYKNTDYHVEYTYSCSF